MDAILVGGAPGVGKTTLAAALAARLGWMPVSFDDLSRAIRVATTPETHPEYHAGAAGHVRYFTDGPPEKLIEDAERLAEATWPVVHHLVRTRRAIGTPVVTDWWLLDPRRVAAEAGDETASVWLTIDDDVLLERERANPFFADSEDPEGMLANFMARSRWRNHLIAEHARDLGLPIIHQDGTKSVAELVDLSLGALNTVAGS